MPKTYQIKSFKLGPMDNLIHLLWDTSTKKTIIFDPAWEADFLLDFIKSNGLILDKILITHAHYDHINAVTDLLKIQSVPIFIDKNEYHNPQADVFPKSVNFVLDGDTIKLGKTTINCISTPGHSIGGICYQLSDDVITGDTIFIYGCGHCALPGADVSQLFNSLQYLKQKLTLSLTVHTSHTYGISNTTSWQAQLTGNPFLQIDNPQDFVRYREKIHDKTRTYPMRPMSAEQLNACLNQF